LLRQTDRKLLEVAKSVGYDSDAALSKAFNEYWAWPREDFAARLRFRPAIMPKMARRAPQTKERLNAEIYLCVPSCPLWLALLSLQVGNRYPNPKNRAAAR
jgi:hypothetical protein